MKTSNIISAWIISIIVFGILILSTLVIEKATTIPHNDLMAVIGGGVICNVVYKFIRKHDRD